MRARTRLVNLGVGLVVGLGAGGCGDSPSVALPTPTATITTGAGASRGAPAGGRPAVPVYTGLGAPRADFAGAHRESPNGRGAGQPLFSVDGVNRAGRVTAYAVEFNDRPALSDYERLVSATGVRGLPSDHSTVHTEPNCLVYASRVLKQLLGAAYARVTTTSRTTTASVQSTATPSC